jgi:UDP-glucose 4-epimerase
MQQKKSHFIFSSSCTVYGQADVPINENAAVKSAMSLMEYQTNWGGHCRCGEK